MATEMKLPILHFDQLAHGSPNSRGPIGRACLQRVGAAITGQVRHDDPMALSQQRSDAGPGSAFARRPMKQDQRRAGAELQEFQSATPLQRKLRHQRRLLYLRSIQSRSATALLRSSSRAA